MELIVSEDHVGGLPGNLSAPFAHSHAAVGPTQGGAVVAAVAGHRYYVTGSLTGGGDVELLRGGGRREHLRPRQSMTSPPADDAEFCRDRAAVAGWSPVTSTGVTLAAWQDATVAAVATASIRNLSWASSSARAVR